MRDGSSDRTDAELMREARRDPSAFGELYRRHVQTVHGWFARRLDWAASDLTAETFAQAWLSRSTFRDVDARLSPRASLAEALERLPEHERETLELRVLDGLPYGEIAGTLSIRPAAARLRVSRALRRLSLTTLEEDR